MLRLLICSYPFKGSYSAAEACGIVGAALSRHLAEIRIELAPLGDGGGGTLDALLSHEGARRLVSEATLARGEKREAAWGRRSDGVAVIEAAQIVGLASLPTDRRDPLGLTTRGIGELVIEAEKEGSSKIWIGLGDTATHDCGIGMASALGYRFLDADGEELDPIGRSLARLSAIDSTRLAPAIGSLEVTALCDVLNTLDGEDGAALRFLKQKGGTSGEIAMMEEATGRFIEIVRRDLGVKLDGLAGAGAAGGLGAGIAAFLGGRLVGGAAHVLDAVEIDRRLSSVDLAITGEGRVDRGTLLGKGTSRVVERARRAGVPPIIVAGSVDGDRAELEEKLGATIVTLAESGDGLPGTIESIGVRLRDVVTRLIRI